MGSPGVSLKETHKKMRLLFISFGFAVALMTDREERDTKYHFSSLFVIRG